MQNQTLEQLFHQISDEELVEQIQMSASGSNRLYYRLKGKSCSYVGVYGTNVDENKAFLYMAQHFAKKGLRVPKILAVSDDQMAYIQEDLGDTLLFNYISEGRSTGEFSEWEKSMLRKTMRCLAQIQYIGAQNFDFNQCFPQPEFNLRSILWDLNYFKYCFLKASAIEFQENRLEDDFNHLADILLQTRMDTFMYRDFQSRNVMIFNNEPYFIDFQGGRKGPIYYDIASFLWQAQAHYNDELRKELVGEYIDEMRKFMPLDRDEFDSILKHFVLFRTLQVLGAYGFRGYFEKKPYFLQSIPYAIDNLKKLVVILQDSPYPYLVEVLTKLAHSKQFEDISSKKPLVVTIYSFSYKIGIPQDKSGNGGGFVFDCRAINNPGKYSRYTQFTGLDKPVIDFLETDGEITIFLEHVYQLVDASVKRYIQRGFQNLMVSFGCTGGQHRSVYAAQKLAEHINNKFGVEIRLIHREQEIETTLPAK